MLTFPTISYDWGESIFTLYIVKLFKKYVFFLFLAEYIWSNFWKAWVFEWWMKSADMTNRGQDFNIVIITYIVIEIWLILMANFFELDRRSENLKKTTVTSIVTKCSDSMSSFSSPLYFPYRQLSILPTSLVWGSVKFCSESTKLWSNCWNNVQSENGLCGAAQPSACRIPPLAWWHR